jgi:copper homeostasis protein
MERIRIETPVYTVEGAQKAAAAGVDRLSLPVFTMIRHRGGDFVNVQDEIDVMVRDVEMLWSAGADGFVFGALTSESRVDTDACRRLIAAAEGRPCTFHRAFDLVLDFDQALEAIIDLGFRRVLTSGGASRVGDGIDVIARLLEHAAGRIAVMPGGGLTPNDVQRLRRLGGAESAVHEVHAGCRGFRPTRSTRAGRVQLSVDPFSATRVLTLDPACVRELIEACSPTKA